ncbi:MAG TPA: hypothetical protein VKD71_14065 [Gemmataceae bacterium]|nr:hypothetical protein [Gemmataceae bacterium]
MWRRLLVLLGLVVSAGCVTPDDRREWADAMRDLRGENMRLRSGPAVDTNPLPKAGE